MSLRDQIEAGINYDKLAQALARYDYNKQLVMKNIKGNRSQYKYGRNAAVGVTEEDCISQGGLVTLITEIDGTGLRFKSSQAADTALGTGARTVLFIYLDSNFDTQSELVTMNGTSYVNTVATDIKRPLRALVKTSGSGLKNAGNITFEHLSSAITYLQIDAVEGQSLFCAFTVPRGKVCLITGFLVSSLVVNKGCVFTLRVNADENGEQMQEGLYLNKFSIDVINGSLFVDVPNPLRVNEKCDIKFSVVADTADGSASAIIGYILIDEDQCDLDV